MTTQLTPAEDRLIVLLASPFSGKSRAMLAQNVLYGRAALRDSLLRGEAPMASHLLYAQQFVLDDDIATERQIGTDAGLTWLHAGAVNKLVVYADRGISPGMTKEIELADKLCVPVEHRSLPTWAITPK